MGPAPAAPDAFRRRLVGLYALTLMDREGPLHGYGLSEKIADRTDGAWRPGPGSVYPSLRKLVSGGLARPRRSGRRREYAITPAGRALLLRIRQRSDRFGGTKPDLSPLWAEVMGTKDVGTFLLGRLHRTLDSLESHLEHVGNGQTAAAPLREAAVRELSIAIDRLERGNPPLGIPPVASPRRRRAH